MRLRISIAVAAYNGSKYISAQLDSYAKQTLLPDELVICDDLSKDDTCKIIKEFSLKAPFAVKLLNNSINIGVTKNFEKALKNTTGDIIFISDQDDIWLENKLERYLEVFNSQRDVDIIFSNLTVVDENAKDLGIVLYNEAITKNVDEFNSNRISLVKSILSMKMCVNGGTIAIRRKILPTLLPIPEVRELIHDGWISRVATATSISKMLPESFSLYRQHSCNYYGYKSSSIKKRLFDAVSENRERKTQESYWLSLLIQRLSCIDFDKKNEILHLYRGKKEALDRQITLYEKTTLYHIFILMEDLISGNYHKYFKGYTSFTIDFLSMLYRLKRK